MAHRPTRRDVEAIRAELVELLTDFKTHLRRPDLRDRVKALVPAFHKLQDLGCSLMPVVAGAAGMKRMLYYLRKYVGVVIAADELVVVSGTHDWPRRVRQLRTEDGWQIITGLTARHIVKDESDVADFEVLRTMKPDDYMLVSDKQDTETAYRWRVANRIRRGSEGVRRKLLEFLRLNVGRELTSEELRYVANNRTEWARRSRELRTVEGWPLLTRVSGRPDLPVGVYVLEEDRQAPAHDRKIKDPVRRAVLQRDGYKCRNCAWTHSDWNRSDPRHLELHHEQFHAKGGSNEASNLTTLCTKCHDEVHALKPSRSRT